MKKEKVKVEPVLSNREILVLAKCELAKRLQNADSLCVLYSKRVSEGDSSFFPCLEQANKEAQRLYREYSYLDDLLWNTSDYGWEGSVFSP